MLRRKLDRWLLIGGQFAFLFVGLICNIVETGRHRPSSFPNVVLILIGGHTMLLVILAWRLRLERCQEDASAATLTEKLNQALKKANDLIECSSDLVWEVDSCGRFTFVSDHNAVMGENFGPRVGSLVTDLADLDPVTPRETWAQQLASNTRGEAFRDFQYSLRRADGRLAYFCVNGIPIQSETGELVGFRGTTRDRTDEVEALQALNHQALHDTLTGLPNRRFLMNKLDGLVSAPASPVAVLQLDLDGFKTINDLHGHAIGDGLLCQVAKRLCEVIRATDFACRLGGD